MHLRALYRGAHSYLPHPHALDGLSAEQAALRPGGAPHSIAEVVAHMAFWQDWFLDRCEGTATPNPPAVLGWPHITPDQWAAVRARFDHGFERALTLAKDDARVTRPITPPLEFDHLASYTIGDALTHLALHNAHHLGQVITLRQQIGAWPPPRGSWTW